jgi:hypothetical protein
MSEEDAQRFSGQMSGMHSSAWQSHSELCFSLTVDDREQQISRVVDHLSSRTGKQEQFSQSVEPCSDAAEDVTV